MEFTLIPYVGALPITFEMSAPQVKKHIGRPTRMRVEDGEREEFRWSEKAPWMPLKVHYSPTGKVVEIAFRPECDLKYKGMELYRQPDLLHILAREDTRPKKAIGTIVFLELGIALSGFEEPSDEKSISVFAKGRWDNLMDHLKNYKLS